MSSTTHIIEGDTDRKISALNPIFACICGLLLLTYSLPESVSVMGASGIPEFLVVAIALCTIIVAITQYCLQIRHRFNGSQEPSADISAVHSLVNKFSKSNDEKGRNVLLKVATQKIVQGATGNKLSSACNSPEIDLLHQYIDECAKRYGTSGFQLLLATILQRMEHHLANTLIRLGLLVIGLGRVRLSFLGSEESAREFYSEMWFEDIGCMETVRQRTRFGAFRIVDALGIVWDYGSVGRVALQIKATVRKFKSKKNICGH